MKRLYAISALLMVLLMIFLPLLAVSPSNGDTGTKDKGGKKAPNIDDVFKIMDKDTEKVTSYSEFDYICGVLFAEMPPTYEVEALKAQAVAAYTMAYRRRGIERQNPNKALKGADFSNDPNVFQGFISKEQAKERFKEKYDEYNKKIEDCVRAVQGKLITYNEEPVLAVYHAISGGKTETPENVWGSGPEYLVPVESVGDLLASDYQKQTDFTPDEIKEKLKSFSIKFPETSDKWFTDKVSSNSGTVLTVKVGDKTLTGQELRKALSLRSANFDIVYNETDKKFTIICRGYGHDVGMSQYGANYMASEGSSYKEILEWYYPNCTVE